ncbi:MAG: hypothetical protein ACJASX_004003, partial [Limisphaerales bacterium]
MVRRDGRRDMEKSVSWVRIAIVNGQDDPANIQRIQTCIPDGRTAACAHSYHEKADWILCCRGLIGPTLNHRPSRRYQTRAHGEGKVDLRYRSWLGIGQRWKVCSRWHSWRCGR